MKCSSEELKRYAKATLKGKYGPFVGATAIYIIMLAASTIINRQLALANLGYGFYIIGKCISLTMSIIVQLLLTGLTYQAMKACRGQVISASDVFYAFGHSPSRFIKVALAFATIPIITNFLTYVYPILVSFLPENIAIIGVVLLTIAFIGVLIYLSILMFALTLSFNLLIDYPQMRAIDALKTSCRLMKGHKGNAFYISLSFIGWFLLGFITLGIGLLWIFPYVQMTMAYFYFDIIGALGAPTTPTNPVGEEEHQPIPQTPSKTDNKPTE